MVFSVWIYINNLSGFEYAAAVSLVNNASPVTSKYLGKIRGILKKLPNGIRRIMERLPYKLTSFLPVSSMTAVTNLVEAYKVLCKMKVLHRTTEFGTHDRVFMQPITKIIINIIPRPLLTLLPVSVFAVFSLLYPS